MLWQKDLLELLRAITVVVAMVLVVGGTVLLLHSGHSPHTALHAVIFFGIAGGLGWAAKSRGKYF